MAELLSGSAYPAQAYAAAGRDGALLTLFAGRCVRMLEDAPEQASDCPAAGNVQQTAAEVGEEGAMMALNRLAAVLGQSRAAAG